ncbi:C6 transcription factor [Penicillium waksmanii]|uniref:C6 transcription factor n=1 Tax=Penicillium waksmanii TaxID=69791 RepID=UPI002546E000|nr:C6 transcription factor [Penicillium waksmanii]KAJ5975113.1 C6 transcription factor [Penicillium waksmanii]
MCKQTKSGSGHSGDDLRNLYSEVLQSDRELKQLVDGMPRFFRLKENLDGETPRNIVQQNRVLSISIAHKVWHCYRNPMNCSPLLNLRDQFYCIHRHFQIMSLKDPWFAYTKVCQDYFDIAFDLTQKLSIQVSCLPLMRRYLMDFLSLPDHPDTHIVSNLWTVNAQVLTAAVWLLFELIFSKDENEQIFETHEIRDLALRSLQFLQVNQSKSTIAKRGVGLIESLLDTEQAIKAGTRKQFSLKEIISRVEVESDSGSNVAMELSSDPCVSHVSDLLLGDNMAWEDIFSVFDM